jgi:hypothetical protein
MYPSLTHWMQYETRQREQRMHCSLLATHDELTLATQLINVHLEVEIPGKWNRTADGALVTIVLPETRTLANFVTAP